MVLPLPVSIFETEAGITRIKWLTYPGGHLDLVMGYWRCAAGWGRIFTSRLTTMGSSFQAFKFQLSY